MIVKEEFLSRLRKIFDLNLYEVKVWTALLSRVVSTAGELSNIGNVPRSRTYDILESLERKGFIVMKLGKPIKFIALKPNEVIERAKRNFVVEAQNKSKRLEQLKGEDVLQELNMLFTKGIKYVEPHELSGLIKGRNNLHSHMDMMIKNAEKSLTIVTSEEGLNREVEALKASLERAGKKGIKIRIAAPITKNNIKAAKIASKFADVRVLEDIKARFAMKDAQELLFMILDDDEVHHDYDTGVWINSKFFSNALGNMFELAWQDMQSLSKVKV